MYRIFLIVIALIVYGSLYPWDFHSAHLAASPLWVLIHSWPTAINRFLFRDIAVNILIYIPIGMFGFLALRQNFSPTIAVTLTLLLAVTLSSSIEMIQLFDDSRDCSASDVSCNFCGAAIGGVLAYLYQQWLRRFISRAETSALLHPSAAVLLFYTWVAYQVFPLFPTLSRTKLGEKLGVLFAQVSISSIETFTYFVEWLVAAQLLASALGARRTRRLLPLLLFVLPAKLLIAGRTLNWSELSGALFACTCFYVFGGYERCEAIVAGLMIALLILRGLAPYHWSSVASQFSWIPFGGVLGANQDAGLLTLLRKCFWYGSAIWLLRAAGWRLVWAACAVALLLGTLEVMQVHLPGRVAEITDPLLAVLLAVVIGLLERSPNRPADSLAR